VCGLQGNEGSTTRLFADDCALHRDIKTTGDARKLQDDLEQLQKWERDWLMEFHLKKCQVTNITSKINIISHKYNIILLMFGSQRRPSGQLYVESSSVF
jgi:hypothetical protein